MVVSLYSESPDRLEIRTRPPSWLPVVAFAAAIGALVWLAPQLVLALTRSPDGQVCCTVYSQLFGIATSGRTISNVLGATLEFPADRGGSVSRDGISFDDTSRIVLQTREGPVPLGVGYTCGLALHREAAEELNRFLRDSGAGAATVILRTSIWIWTAVGFLWFVALGLAFATRTRCVVDGRMAETVLYSPSLLGMSVRRFPLAEVEQFAMRQKLDVSSDEEDSLPESLRTEKTFVRLAAVLRNGEELTVADRVSNWQLGLSLARKLERLRKAVA